MTLQEYTNKVIATAIHNGMTVKELKTCSSESLAKSHLEAQLKAIDQAVQKLGK